MMLPDRRTLAYACIPFAFGLIHCPFYFFYVKVFLNSYKVSEWWFHFSQVTFMVWNAVNDPLIGFLMNNPRWRCSKVRRLPLLYGGPVYALTFLVPWFPWRSAESAPWVCGLHLTVSLCLYDTLFSYIGLTGCCLLTEMTDDYRQRLNMKWFGALASILAGWSIPFLNLASDNLADLRGFQTGAALLALMALVAVGFAGRNATTQCEEGGPRVEGGPSAVGPCCRPGLVEVEAAGTWALTKSILRSRDFMAFIGTEFLESFHLTFWSSFTTIFVDNLVPVSATVKSVFFGLTTIAPSILYMMLRGPLERFGYHRMYMWNIVSKIVFSLAMIYFGPRPWLYLVFIFVDVVLGDMFARLADVMMADVTEKLMRESLRSHPNSSVLVGLNAFLTKPASSLAPMLIVNLLNRAGYQQHVASKGRDLERSARLNSVMFAISCAVPLVIGGLQLVAWSFYTIRVHVPRDREPRGKATESV